MATASSAITRASATANGETGVNNTPIADSGTSKATNVAGAVLKTAEADQKAADQSKEFAAKMLSESEAAKRLFKLMLINYGTEGLPILRVVIHSLFEKNELTTSSLLNFEMAEWTTLAKVDVKKDIGKALHELLVVATLEVQKTLVFWDDVAEMIVDIDEVDNAIKAAKVVLPADKQVVLKEPEMREGRSVLKEIPTKYSFYVLFLVRLFKAIIPKNNQKACEIAFLNGDCKELLAFMKSEKDKDPEIAAIFASLDKTAL
jgi:hypothetical protein